MPNISIVQSEDFTNLFFHTVFRIGKDGVTISYEVFRCIRMERVIKGLPCFRMSPQFLYSVPVSLSSSLVSLPETVIMDKNNFAIFYYPLPLGYHVGDVITMHYKMLLKYPQGASVSRFTLRSANDSMTEIHDVVLDPFDSAPDAKLTRIGDKDFVERTVESIPFNKETHSYRFTLINPEKDVRYSLSWEGTNKASLSLEVLFCE